MESSEQNLTTPSVGTRGESRMNKRLKFGLTSGLFFAFGMLLCLSPNVNAQATFGGQRFQVDDNVDQLEIVAGTARRLKFRYEIPEIMVENPDVIQATPVSTNEILITGLKPGVSTFTVSDPNKNIQMINVEVKVDTRKLELALKNYFPDSQVKVHPLNTGVILAGHVARADQVSNITQVARDFFPNVVNHLQVHGNQNIAIKVKVYEVSRNKLKQLGINWSYLGDEFSLISSAEQLIQAFGTAVAPAGDTLAFSVLDGNEGFFAAIDALERHDVAKVLDQPILVAQNGRPAEFLSGGEIPIQVAGGLGTNSIEFRPFGTKLDMVPIVSGNGELTLEVRVEVSDVDPTLAVDGVPGFRVRRVNTGVKMRAGHTLALAGDYRDDYTATKQGVPGLISNPILGPLFRRVENEQTETELVFLISPRFISDVEETALPELGPGQLTTAPSTRELFHNGYIEVPRCKDDCPVPRDGATRQNQLAPQQQHYPGSGSGTQGYPSQQVIPGPSVNPYPPQPGSFPPPVSTGSGSGSFGRNAVPARPNSSRRPEVDRTASSANNSFLWPDNNTQTR